MKLNISGYSLITSKKDGKQYTNVHGVSDIPFSNGKGFQNYSVFLLGHRNDLQIGKTYTCVTDTAMRDGQLVTRVTDLTL